MSEQNYTYRDNTFNANQAYNYILLIQIELDNFSYAVIEDEKLLAFDTACNLNELTEPKELFDLLIANYKKTVIGLSASGFTLIPSSIYKADKISDFGRLLDVQLNEKVLAEAIDGQNYIVYKVNERLVAAAEKYNINNAVYANAGWITAIAKNNPLNNNLYLNITDTKADYLCFSDGKLRFYNSFDYKNDEDLAYYTAFVAQELNLDPQSINLVLSGEHGDKTGKGLADFFTSIAFNNQQILELPEQIASHQILTLAALSLCGSSEAH